MGVGLCHACPQRSEDRHERRLRSESWASGSAMPARSEARTVMSALPQLAERVDGVRSRWRRAEPGQRFLDRPYASVQLLLASSCGLLVFGVLMAVSTTISAASDTSGGAPPSIWSQVIKEAIFIAIGLPIF